MFEIVNIGRQGKWTVYISIVQARTPRVDFFFPNYIAYSVSEVSVYEFFDNEVSKNSLQRSENPLANFRSIRQRSDLSNNKSWRTSLSDKAICCRVLTLNTDIFGVFFSVSSLFWDMLNGRQHLQLRHQRETNGPTHMSVLLYLIVFKFFVSNCEHFTCESMGRGNPITSFWPRRNPSANSYFESSPSFILHRCNVSVKARIRQRSNPSRKSPHWPINFVNGICTVPRFVLFYLYWSFFSFIPRVVGSEKYRFTTTSRASGSWKPW